MGFWIRGSRKSKPGYIFNQKVFHEAIINIQDYAENTIEISAYFISDTLPRFDYSTHFQNNECKIIFNNDQVVNPDFFLTGSYLKDQIIPTEYFDLGNNTYLIKNISPPLNVIQISGKNNFGISSQPTFHMKPQQDFNSAGGELKIKHYEHGIIITFEEKIFTGMNAYISIRKEGIMYPYALERDSKHTLSSKLIRPIHNFRKIT